MHKLLLSLSSFSQSSLLSTSPYTLILSLYTSLCAGNLSIGEMKQVGCKMQNIPFGKHGLSGDVNAAEEMIKEFLPEDIKMCDVTYPRYLNSLVQTNLC